MINQIEARYFRRLKHIQVNLAPGVTLVVGENGAGKSSLAAAVEFGLTGACRWTDRRGAGYKILINHEAADVGSTVVLDTDFTGVVERQLTPFGTSVGVDGREGSSAKALLSVNLPEPEILNAMLRSDGFTSLSPKEQQEMLFMLDGGRTGADWFKAHLTPEEIEVLEERLSSKATGSALSEKLYEFAYAARAVANKQGAAAKAKRDQYQRPAPAPTGGPTHLGEQLDVLREEQAALHERIGATNTRQVATAGARVRQETAREETTRIKGAMDALSNAVVPTAEEMEQTEAQLADARAAMSEADTQARASQMVLTNRKGQLERFVQLGSGCVLGNVECPMDETTRARIVEDERQAVQRLEEALRTTQQQSDETARLAGEAADALGLLRDRKVIAESIARDRDRFTEDLTRATKRLNDAMAEAAEVEESDVEALRGEAAGLTAKISGIEQVLSAAARCQEGITEYERLSSEAEAAVAKAAMLNDLVAKLAPDGLPAQAMGAVTAEVLARINEVLAQFTEFQLTAEPGANFLLSVVVDRYETPVFALSESEELRVGTAIQVALAVLTGFGFIVVDAADRLDGKNRERLLVMLAAQPMVQALVLATPAAAMTDKQRAALVGLGIKLVEIVAGEVVSEAA